MFVFLSSIYALLSSGRTRSPDEYMALFQSESLIDRGWTAVPQSLATHNFYGKYDLSGQPRSPYPAGLALVATPFVWFARDIVSQLPGVPQSAEFYLAGFGAALANASIAAAVLAVFFLLVRRLGLRARDAMVLSFCVAFGTLLFPYSGYFFSEPLSALLFMLSAYLLFGPDLPAKTEHTLAAGAVLAAAIWVRPTNVLAVAVFALAILASRGLSRSSSPGQRLGPEETEGPSLRSGCSDFGNEGGVPSKRKVSQSGKILPSKKQASQNGKHPERRTYRLEGPCVSYGYARILRFLSLPFVSGLAYLWRNRELYGRAFDFGYPAVSDFGKHINSFDTPIHTGLFGFLLSPGKSLLLFAPILLLAPLGLRTLWHRNRGLAVVCAGLPLIYLLFYMRYTQWEGGYCVGPRYLLPSALVACVAVAPLFADRRSWAKPAVIALSAVGFAVQVISYSTSFLEDQVGTNYYDSRFNYRMSYDPMLTQSVRLLSYLRGKPAALGFGFDRWFVFLAKAGVDAGTLLIIASPLLALALWSGWRLRKAWLLSETTDEDLPSARMRTSGKRTMRRQPTV